MARNIKKISETINAEFQNYSDGSERRLIFWFDEKKEFQDDIDLLELENAKVYRLEKNDFFHTKYFFEREDKTTNYLVYAPFARPDVEQNHLEDMIRYSGSFSADRISLVCTQMNIPMEVKPILQHFANFFANNNRCEKFEQYRPDVFNEETIEIAIMAAICRSKDSSFEEIVRILLTEAMTPKIEVPSSLVTSSDLIDDLGRYGLLERFWHYCNTKLGYEDTNPSFERLACCLYISCLTSSLDELLPTNWLGLRSKKNGSVVSFMNTSMNNTNYESFFNNLSDWVAKELKAEKNLANADLKYLLDCDVFRCIERLFISWVAKQIGGNNLQEKIRDQGIAALCEKRKKTHFGKEYLFEYDLLIHALFVISQANYEPPQTLNDIASRYRDCDSRIDNHYRHFYYCYDKIIDKKTFDQIRELVENIYVNEYLAKLTGAWSDALVKENIKDSQIPSQHEFFARLIGKRSERTIIIVSDALRYEVALDLWNKFNGDVKCELKGTDPRNLTPHSPDIQICELPTTTMFGMAALLPHKKMELSLDCQHILVDGKAASDKEKRTAILQTNVPQSCCVLLDEIKNMKKDELRVIFQDKKVVYVYHNQIDARGDKANTEDEVFNACEEAVNEIHELVRKLTEAVSATTYFITADHGFLYQRHLMNESDKIALCGVTTEVNNKRFIVTRSKPDIQGTCSFSLSSIWGCPEPMVVTVPRGASIFKTSGTGQNYVHGGTSPQEMLVPVLFVKTLKGAKETKPVPIAPVSIRSKITSMRISLNFIQNEPVCDEFKATRYRMHFASKEGEIVSNEINHLADNVETDDSQRIFPLQFQFKNQQYDPETTFYLRIYNVDRTLDEPLEYPVIMDIPYANDFGF